MVSKCTICHKIYMIGIIEAIMRKIVTRRGNYGRYNVEVSELGNFMQSAFFNHHEHHLSDVNAVQVVVIGDICAVARKYFVQKLY